jgi:hypothetical protein
MILLFIRLFHASLSTLLYCFSTQVLILYSVPECCELPTRLLVSDASPILWPPKASNRPRRLWLCIASTKYTCCTLCFGNIRD